MRADAGILRHHHDVRDPGSGEAGENAEHSVGPVGDLKAAGMSDDPADVPGRNRICNDAHDRTGHDSLPHYDCRGSWNEEHSSRAAPEPAPAIQLASGA